MGRSHQRWAALAGAASVSMVGFGLLASAANADDPQAWPVVSQKSQDAYSLDGYELGRLPQGLADFGVQASSSNDNQGNRTSQISWVRGSAVYGQVTSLRSDAITNLDDLRAAQYGHLDSDSLQRIAIDGREAYHSTETGDLFWVEEPGSAVTVFLLPERWNSSELRDFATSIAGADAIDAAVEDAEESAVDEEADADADTHGAEEDAPAEDAAEDAEGDAEGTEEAPDAEDAGDTTGEADQDTAEGAEETDASEEEPAEDASHDDADAVEEEPADEPAGNDQQPQTDPVSNVGEDAPEAGTETDADTETETGADTEAETEAGTEADAETDTGADADQAEDAAEDTATDGTDEDASGLTDLAPEQLPDFENDAELEETFLDCVDQVLLEDADAELTEGQTTQEALDGAAQVCAEELGIDTAEADQDGTDGSEDTKESEGSRPSFWTLLPWA